MFPKHSGIYIAQKDGDVVIVKVKGVYPSLQLDKKALYLSEFVRKGKTTEVPPEMFDNMELYHQRWDFRLLDFANFGVFSKTEFVPSGTNLFLSEEDMYSLRNMYYRLCEQGVAPTKVIRAVSYEYKIPKEQVISLVNGFDSEQ